MGNQDLPQDFREFLKLLNENKVEYLLIGGDSVGYHGYPRTTVDMDVWVANYPEKPNRHVATLTEFGMKLKGSIFPRICPIQNLCRTIYNS